MGVLATTLGIIPVQGVLDFGCPDTGFYDSQEILSQSPVSASAKQYP
jgi:hypothetical protein